jgi:hypothetical protein
MSDIQNFINHLSEKPWSMYTASDYSIEQWHAACLIHQHEGPPTTKEQCKLPCKTPNGTVNRNGVYAAAAALGGARGGINASSEQKTKAAKVLIGYYKEMGKEPPASLLKHSNANQFLQHYGKKGMKWGIRNRRSRKETQVRTSRQRLSDRRRQLSDTDLKTFVERLNNEKKLKTLIEEDLKPGKTVAKKILSSTGQKVISTVASGTAILVVKTLVERKLTPKGKERAKLKINPKEAADIISRGGVRKK